MMITTGLKIISLSFLALPLSLSLSPDLKVDKDGREVGVRVVGDAVSRDALDELGMGKLQDREQ